MHDFADTWHRRPIDRIACRPSRPPIRLTRALRLCLLGLAAGFACPAAAQGGTTPSFRPDLRATLQQALESYDRGVQLSDQDPSRAQDAFRQARDAFRTILDAGILNGRLLYNLGNTHLRLGEIGLAIAAYRMAQKLIPGDAQLTDNLRYARSLRRDAFQPKGGQEVLRNIFFLHYRLPFTTRRNIALIAYGLFWMLLTARIFTRKRPLNVPIAASLLVCVSFGVSAAISLPTTDAPRDGVLIADEVVIRKGDGDAYEPLFAQPLHQGTEFRVLDRRDRWVRIELPDGNQGWVRQDDAVLF